MELWSLTRPAFGTSSTHMRLTSAWGRGVWHGDRGMTKMGSLSPFSLAYLGSGLEGSLCFPQTELRAGLALHIHSSDWGPVSWMILEHSRRNLELY